MLLRIIGHIFALDREVISLQSTGSATDDCEVGVKKLETSLCLRYETYFDNLHILGVDHECDRMTDRRTNG